MFQITPKLVTRLFFLERDNILKAQVSHKRNTLFLFLGRQFLSSYHSITSFSDVEWKPTKVIQIKGSFSQIFFNNTALTNALNASPGYTKTHLLRIDMFVFSSSIWRYSKQSFKIILEYV